MKYEEMIFSFEITKKRGTTQKILNGKSYLGPEQIVIAKA